jgi:hypothetical protein
VYIYWAALVRATGTVRKRQAVRPVHHVQKSHLPGHSHPASQAGRRVWPALWPSASLYIPATYSLEPSFPSPPPIYLYYIIVFLFLHFSLLEILNTPPPPPHFQELLFPFVHIHSHCVFTIKPITIPYLTLKLQPPHTRSPPPPFGSKKLEINGPLLVHCFSPPMVLLPSLPMV